MCASLKDMTCELRACNPIRRHSSLGRGTRPWEGRQPFSEGCHREMSPTIFKRTICSTGEASRKLSSCEILWNPSVGATDKLKEVKFGKTKWFKGGKLLECNPSSWRFTVLPKGGSEGGIVVSGLSRLMTSKTVILRVRRSGRGPESNFEKFQVSSWRLKWMYKISSYLICLVWKGSSATTPTGSMDLANIPGGDPPAF